MFHFKQFSIDDSRSGLKTGTDGVLLGAWTSVNGLTADSLVIDAGAGCGLVGLLIAARCQASVYAVEIDSDACLDCEDNFKAFSGSERLSCQCEDFLKWIPRTAPALIVSNPPFFTNGERAPRKNRAAARHEDSLPLSELIRHSALMLEPRGRLSLISPAEREEEIIYIAALAGLAPCRLCRVSTREGQKPRRLLVELKKGTADTYTESFMAVRDCENKYTAEYTALTGPYYTKL